MSMVCAAKVALLAANTSLPWMPNALPATKLTLPVKLPTKARDWLCVAPDSVKSLRLFCLPRMLDFLLSLKWFSA
jgi:hypothetical protein